MKANASPVTETSFTDTGLRNAQTYYYVVTALDGPGNESGSSNEVNGLPHFDHRLGQPAVAAHADAYRSARSTAPITSTARCGSTA